jgi:16S rRNA (cytidine1402-2'-O)-methyltransferase
VPGTLFLLPCPISPGTENDVMPVGVRSTAHALTYFLAENAKSTRAFLKAIGHPCPMRDIDIVEIGHTPDPGQVGAWLDPIAKGRDGALVSDAGCPAVADPGSNIVSAAHDRGLAVRPLVGPSSLLLALMASGLNGQRFRFHGYLPVPANERSERLVALERESRSGETQIFIETPYRSSAMFDSILASCAPATRLSLATDLTSANELVMTRTVAGWRLHPQQPNLARRPTVFALLARFP